MRAFPITFATIFVTKQYGFYHINTRLNQTDKEGLESVKGGNLPATPYNDLYSNVTFNIQYNADDDQGGYGFIPALNDVHNLDLDDAEKTLKILRKVTKGYNTIRSEGGSKRFDALPSLISFLEAANVKRVFIRYLDTVGFDNLSVKDAIIELTRIDDQFTKGGV